MSRYSGPQQTGAARTARAARRTAAEKRNAATPNYQRAEFRRTRARIRAAINAVDPDWRPPKYDPSGDCE